MATTFRLAEVTAANFDAAIGVQVHPDQDHLVAPVVKSLAEAYVHPGTAWPRLILDGDRMTTTWHPGEDGPEGFYLRLGFVPTGETSGDQTVGELALD
ncbi:hypothetical protein ACIQUM_33560 [Amycolatopsis azurea]|uniref:hypothetical protein n=1 Tax=Amycolatopsis azurea TaxID=36819 RepID=UPI00380B8BAB